MNKYHISSPSLSFGNSIEHFACQTRPNFKFGFLKKRIQTLHNLFSHTVYSGIQTCSFVVNMNKGGMGYMGLIPALYSNSLQAPGHSWPFMIMALSQSKDWHIPFYFAALYNFFFLEFRQSKWWISGKLNVTAWGFNSRDWHEHLTFIFWSTWSRARN